MHLATPGDMDSGMWPTPAKKQVKYGDVSTMREPYIDITEPPTRGAAQGKIVEMVTGMKMITGIFNVASSPLGKKENDRIPSDERAGTWQ
jgi:hypothetical protein